MEESRQKLYKNVVLGISFLLCIFFFVLPIAVGTYEGSDSWFFSDSSNEGLTASGLQIATGSGDLFDASSDGAYPVAFLLLLAPVTLLILIFMKVSFLALGIVSSIGLVLKIVFLIVVDVSIGGVSTSPLAWLVVLLYLVLCLITFYSFAKNR